MTGSGPVDPGSNPGGEAEVFGNISGGHSPESADIEW